MIRLIKVFNVVAPPDPIHFLLAVLFDKVLNREGLGADLHFELVFFIDC